MREKEAKRYFQDVAVVFSPDGMTFAAGGTDHVRLYGAGRGGEWPLWNPMAMPKR